MKKFKLSYIDIRLFNIKKSMERPFWSHSFMKSQPCGTPRKTTKWKVRIFNSLFTIIIWREQVLIEGTV